MKPIAGITAITAVLTVGAAPAVGQRAERHALRGADVAIYNLAGRVTIERGTGADVVVEVTRGGSDAERLRVETGPLRGRGTVRIVYPDDNITYAAGRGWGASATLHVRDDGTFGDSDHGGGWRGEGRRVRITTRGGGLEAHADLRVLVPAGQKIAVYLGLGEAAASDVEGDLRIDLAAAGVRTQRTKGTLVLDTGSGKIEVTDAEGDVTLDTGSGGVSATRVRGPQLNIDTGSGGVTVSEAAVDALRIDTGSGGVNATAVRARDISIDTGSGSVTLTLSSDVESLSIDTGSGGVTLAVPESLGAQVEIETGSGNIDFAFPVQATRMGRSHFRGTIGDGRGRIVVETGSGSVRLRRS